MLPPRCFANSKHLRTVILNTSIGGWYPKGAARLQASLRDVGYTGNIQCWINELPPNCRPHSVIPYHFKPMAFRWAVEHGYDIAIWMDSAVYAIRDIQPLIDIIESEGHLLFRNGWTSGEWCCDDCLEPLGITREQSFTYPHIMACVMGFDLNNTTSLESLSKWLEVAPKAFQGPWNNNDKTCSQDERVLGSRHDQTAMSIISTDLNMKWTDVNGIIEYGTTATSDTTMLLSQGL